MERKLVKQGRNALTVTLPSQWTAARGLNAGKSVFIQEQGQGLFVSSAIITKDSTFTVHGLEKSRGVIKHAMMGAYVQGYDRIILESKEMVLAMHLSQNLPGMMIKDQTESRTVFESIATKEENLVMILKRVTFQIKLVASSLVDLSSKKIDLETFEGHERMLNGTCAYALRYLNKYSVNTPEYKYFMIISQIEQAGDTLSYLGKNGCSLKLAKIILQGISDYTIALTEKDPATIREKRDAFVKQIGTSDFHSGVAYTMVHGLYNYLGYIALKE
ncbi:MAG TPA: hypothetical protein VK158_00455 [Acidobacteriota bacterium]|nr:hypothetical protein [Acidobacteriota bacterium]